MLVLHSTQQLHSDNFSNTSESRQKTKRHLAHRMHKPGRTSPPDDTVSCCATSHARHCTGCISTPPTASTKNNHVCRGEKKKKKRKDKKQTTTSAEMLCTLQVLASVKPAPTDATQIYNAGRKAHVTRMDSAQHRAAAVCTPQPPPTPCCRQRWSTPGLHIQMSTSVQGTRRKGLQLGCFYSRPLYKTRPGRHCLQTRVEKAGRTTVAPLPLASLKRDLNSL